MKIETIPIEQIHPYEQNAKAHPPDQVERIARSIREFGFKVPVIVDKANTLMAGHGRLLAAQRLGLREVPAIRADDLTPEQIRAYRIADNKVAESEWMENVLREELAALDDDTFTGFSANELKKLFKESDPPETPELEFSPELLLEHNYIVLYFDNTLDWQVAIEKFKLKKVKSGDPAEKCRKVGIGRVIHGAPWLERIR